MGILNIKFVEVGVVGDNPRIVLIETDDAPATVLSSTYLNDAVQQGYYFSGKEMALVQTTGDTAWYEVVKSGSNVGLAAQFNPGNVTLPVVDNDFANFDGTTGKIKDAGYSPTDAAKTKVVMADAAVSVDRIAVYTDAAGTIGDNASTAVNNGNIQAGVSGAAGKLISFPGGGSSGNLQIQAQDNAGAFTIIIRNSSHAQSTTYTISDVGAANGSLLSAALATSDPNANIVTFDITVGQAALAGAGSVTLQASSGSKQYKIRELYLNAGGTNFSGGGGDRLATISDGTTDYSVIPAATLQSLANARWGDTGLPFPASAAINVSTAAGAALTIAYSGGTTDYTAGSVVISGVLERVA